MEPWISAVLGGAGVAAIGVAGNIVLEWLRRRKTTAEAKSAEADFTVKITERYDSLAQRLSATVDELSRKLQVSEQERAAEHSMLIGLQVEVARLRAEVERLTRINVDLQDIVDKLRANKGKSGVCEALDG